MATPTTLPYGTRISLDAGAPLYAPEPDSTRIDALEREVAALRAELAEVRRQTLGFRWANTSDSEDRATYQAGVE